MWRVEELYKVNYKFTVSPQRTIKSNLWLVTYLYVKTEQILNS